MLDQKQIQELERKLRIVHEQGVMARDAAQQAAESVTEIKAWLTQVQIDVMKAQRSEQK